MKSPDKRYLPRWNVKNRILGKIEYEPVVREFQSKDISCSGLCFSCSDKIPNGKKVKLKIYLSPKKSIEVTGNIKWIKSINNGFDAGVNFCNISETDQETILRYAFEIKRDELVAHFFQGWKII